MAEQVAELQGGLGNQLFILGAGMTLAEKNAARLRLDARSHSSPHERALGIEPVIAELDVVPDLQTGQRGFLERAARVARLRTKSPRYFVEKSFCYDPRFEGVTSDQIILGYFQSFRYMSPSVQQKLFIALETVRTRQAIGTSDLMHVHIRRGDYLSPAASAVHGLASLEYFDRAIERVKRERPQAQFKIFTDSPELIPAQQLNLWNATIETSQASATPLTSLLEMSSGSGLIMSNSSFSWWAAWMMSRRNSTASIIAPRPWFADGHAAHDLLLPEWITLG